MPTRTQPNAIPRPKVQHQSTRALPVIPIAPGASRLAPSRISDTTTKASVDAKLNAALKEAIKQAIGSTHPIVEKFIDTLPLDYHALAKQTVLSVLKKIVVPAMLKKPELADLGKQLQQLKDNAGAATVGGVLQATLPLSQNPLFADDVRQGKTLELLRIANLNQTLLGKLDAGKKQLEAWNDFDWDNVVTQKILTSTQRDDLFFTTELSRLTGEQYELVKAARKTGLKSTADLVEWDRNAWLDLIRKTPNSVPDSVTPDTYAGSLTKAVQQTFPSEYLAARIADKTIAKRLSGSWSKTKELIKNNPDLLTTLDATDVDWNGVKANRQKTLAKTLADVTSFVGTYRHLGVADVLANGRKSAAQNSAEIGRRIGALGRFLQNNKAEDLRYLNLLEHPSTAKTSKARKVTKRSASDNGDLDWTGIAPADQTAVRNQLLAYQRVLHLTEEPDTAMALLRAGFDSSSAVADLGYNAFRNRTGLDDASAASVYRKASSKAALVANTVQLQKDAISSIEQGRYFQGIDPSFVNDLKDLPGYADLFGNTSYCDCEDCRSIFSPAAYFVDLMYFIEKNITKPAFSGKKKHPLRLRNRRPDLWHLKLTCENTDTLIPHLTLVIEILESYLKRTLSIQDVPRKLANDRSAIGLPYHAPLATLREYISDWKITLTDVYETLEAPLHVLLKETLRLSDGEWKALVTATPLDVAWIKFSSSNHTKMDVVDFERFTALSREQISELQATKTAGGFTIERVALSKDIQSEKEVAKALSKARLDRVGRFLRLARSSGYTLTELDELLQTPRITDVHHFSKKALTGLARFKRLSKSLGLSVASLIGVLDHIPTRPMKADAKSLADQLGLAALTGSAGFPLKFHHAHFNTTHPTDSKVDPRLPALLAVVGLVESDLLAVFEACPVAFPFDPQGNCQLTADNVSLLYAYATLARTWSITPGDLILVVTKLLPNTSGNDIRSLDLFEALQQQVTLLKSLPLAISDVFSLLDPANAVVTIDTVVSAVNDLQQSDAQLFGASVLTSLPGITPEDATTILAQLVTAHLLVPSGDKFALTDTYTPGTALPPIQVPQQPDPNLPPILVPLAPAIVAEIHAALMAFHFINLLPNMLAPIAGTDVDKTIVTFAFAQAGWDGVAMLHALATPIVNGVPTKPADLQPLVTLACDLTRLAGLFSSLGMETTDCWFVAQYPSIFGIQDIRALGVADLDAIRRYRQLRSASTLTAAELQNLAWQYQVRANGNQEIVPAPLFDSSASLVPVFRDALESPDYAPLTPAAAPSFTSEALVPSPLNAAEIALLASGSSLDATLLRSIFLSQTLPSNALLGLSRALQLHAFCTLLGVGGHSLGKLLRRDFAGLTSAAYWLSGVLENKYPDQAARDKHILPHTEGLNELQRDALCDYIIARDNKFHFKSHDELYAYFLIDVDMGGCFETSRLVAALSSLQLYVYRCLVDLEQSKSDNLDVLSKIDANDVSQQWEWRKNYRVWEANRKVFIYPEDYLEPELRDDKTPLAKDLEDALLQHKITLSAAQDAYHDYLTGFSTLAQLEVAGVCYDKAHDRYWFVARSHTDPYQYYLRQYHVEAKRWDAWESIDLGISAPYVCPLVHLGRLYLFWVDITSMDNTSFVDGNSIFLSVQHQVKLHYSYRLNNGQWSGDQKLVLIDKIIDRSVNLDNPAFLPLPSDIFGMVSIDKNLSYQFVDNYRSSKTYAKVIVTAASDPGFLNVHYFRSSLRTDIEDKRVSTTVINGKIEQTIDYTPISDQMIDRIYTLTPDLPVIRDKSASSIAYYRAKLDLLRNQLDDIRSGPLEKALYGYLGPDGQPVYTYDYEVPLVEVDSEYFHDPSNGTEAIGILSNKTNPEAPWFALMLRNYADSIDPAATDSMLITQTKSGGAILTNAISSRNPHDMLPINHKQSETILRHWRHEHWIQEQTGKLAPRRLAVRINTTLDFYLTKILFAGGIDQFLSLKTQTSQGEDGLLFSTVKPKQFGFAADAWNVLPFTGSFGTYYREMFFHIPFLIANKLNSQGRYEDAKYWYEKIFNPTAPATQGDAKIKHRVWQYYEFRNLKVPKLKEILTDKATIDVYEHDPFAPFPIARLRMNAFQKAIVMKYVDNLIDWGDDLFRQDTMESVNEATMLYVLAADILGPRPVSVGPCKTADESSLTYEMLGPAVAKGSEFLMYVENVHIQVENEAQVRTTLPGKKVKAGAKNTVTEPTMTDMTGMASTSDTLSDSLRSTGLGSLREYQVQPRILAYSEMTDPALQTDISLNVPNESDRRPARPDMMRQYLPAFCVPANDILLGYWDRIEDRLFKIRNCLNIKGERVTLALFQPPIDPMLLVRAKAAGLSIEDVIGQQQEALPPYRFTFLVEKARQYIGMVQGFGNTLLSVLEKKDGEELSLLKSTYEQNLLKLQRSVKQQQIDDAQAQLAALQSQQQNVQNKIDYYNGLIQGGLTDWENMEQDMKLVAGTLQASAGGINLLSGILYLIADVGSPFAMTYGGKELGSSMQTFAEWYSNMAQCAETAAGAAGLEATFERRSQEWQQQLTLATEEMNQLTKQVLGSQIRLSIAQKDLSIHDTQIEQAADIHDFLKSKFSNVELYTFLSGKLMRLYREAYQMTAQVARQAERAFQFERDSTDVFIQSDNWQSEKSGLLAGERLMLQLNRMEKAYLETNTRDIEVSQSFSLVQIDPSALESLKQTGKCQFTLDETWFDLQYPGQYRRLLKSVRLTIPCVVGPYTNVGAKLRLNGSQVRRVPNADPTLVEDVPLTMTRTIATSHGQNDGGVFDLNFRDERYLPFEGAGAVNSTWSLDLPSQIRMFDYDSISDVIIHLSYLARYDDALADAVETNIVDRLKTYAQTTGLFRLISLRHDFPTEFYQLLNPPVGQPPKTSLTLENKHFPMWLSDQALHISQPVVVWPQAVKGQTIVAAVLALKVTGSPVGNWVADGAGSSKGTVSVSGSPIRSWSIEAAAGSVDKTSLEDLLLLVRYIVL
jgi:Salmonella virulence plasmid 28.